jgi:hypothetical protein
VVVFIVVAAVLCATDVVYVNFGMVNGLIVPITTFTPFWRVVC